MESQEKVRKNIEAIKLLKELEDDKRLANTSAASATVTASYPDQPHTLTNRGVITTAADNPANPVTIPAPNPAIIYII